MLIVAGCERQAVGEGDEETIESPLRPHEKVWRMAYRRGRPFTLCGPVIGLRDRAASSIHFQALLTARRFGA